MKISEGFAQRRYQLLLVMLLLQLAAGPVVNRAAWADQLLFALGLATLGATLFAVAGSRWVFWTAGVLMLPAVAAPFLGGEGGLSELAGSALHAPLFGFAAVVVTTRVLREERVALDTIAGSLCAYFLIAVAFASLYMLIEGQSPGSIAFARGRPEEGLFGELFYFSLVTITTLGYGDITPVAGAALSLTTLESVIGILFPSIVVARLVALVASGGGGRPFASSQSAHRRPGRFEVLLLVSLVLITAGPLLPDHGIAVELLRVLATSMLLAALYVGSGGRWGKAVGVLLAALAVFGEWFAELASGAMGVVGSAAETAFLLLVSGSMLHWLARESSVTRDVLLASLALYLVLGFAFSSAFGLVETLAPGSVLVPDALASSRGQLNYFSFMTLTTTGFGDVAPGTPIVQRLAMLESFVGVFYPPVLVGRLVSLYQSE